jgi:hypothetical protein
MTKHTHSRSPEGSPISIPDLRAAFNGRVIAPDDAAYDEARRLLRRVRSPASAHRPG